MNWEDYTKYSGFLELLCLKIFLLYQQIFQREFISERIQKEYIFKKVEVSTHVELEEWFNSFLAFLS